MIAVSASADISRKHCQSRAPLLLRRSSGVQATATARWMRSRSLARSFGLARSRPAVETAAETGSRAGDAADAVAGRAKTAIAASAAFTMFIIPLLAKHGTDVVRAPPAFRG